MKCPECLENMSAYHDSELSAAEAAEMEKHLSRCPACSAEARASKDSADLVESHLGELELRPDVWNKVYARISSLPSRRTATGLRGFLLSHRWATATAGLAVALAITAGGWGYLRYERSERELLQYMSKYVEMREGQEKSHRSSSQPLHQVAHSEFSDNPFISPAADSTYRNPFLKEAQ